MKKLVTLSAVALSLLAASALAADVKIAVVNYADVFKQVPQGQATLDQLKQKFGPQEDALAAKRNSLLSALQDYQRNMSTMSSKGRQAKEASLDKQQQDFQQQLTALQNQEAQAQQNASGAFQSALVAATKQVAKAGGYNLVVSDQAAPYYDSSFDISDQVASVMQKGDK